MSKNLGSLLEEIHELERAVSDKIQQTKQDLPFEIAHGRAFFRPDVRRRHKIMAKRAWRTIRESSFLTFATAPVIYSLLIPISLLDLLVTVYQWTCFPIYRIPRVRRDEYVVIDRHLLGYLNVIEKINCIYCGYGNGVLAYAREIASRTEQYWCPIKHAKHVKGCHARQCLFCEFGDADGYSRSFTSLRTQFSDLEAPEASQ
ncbi:hypothetical protein K227x_05330 [Rubripirellula lacrimiformis]|uniref:Uncharacterized protein n=1 Tax=Rubripirellula lacrimiformis TaxID=1930273 RepID=A0A517N4V7_9BACT|nr:hypothetical protein [Rubripirellula lacrimiformis]QDT02162.1 hypothetical protein K227x_05330 [Rubripirellula lacrimiformis]